MDTTFMEQLIVAREQFVDSWDSYQGNGSSYDPNILRDFAKIIDEIEQLREKILNRHPLEIVADILPEEGPLHYKGMEYKSIRDIFESLDREKFINIAGPLTNSFPYKKLKNIFAFNLDMTLEEPEKLLRK